MRGIPSLLSRLIDVVWRRSREDRLDEEIRVHLELLADEFTATGMPRDEAMLAARRAFGNIDATRIAHREQRGLRWLDALWQDVRFGVRLLTRERGFALTAIVVLGIGIGVNNMFFTLVYAHKFRGLDIPRANRVMAIYAYDDRTASRPLSLDEFDELRTSQTTFAGLAGHVIVPVTIGDLDRAPDRVEATYLSSGAFELLGIEPLMGRLPSPDQDRPGAAPIVMLGADTWHRRYGSDAGILGRTILVNGMPATVTAIVPERSGFPSTAAAWLPLGQWPGVQNRDTRALSLFGRLRDTAAEADARIEIETLFGRLETLHPDTNRHVRARVIPINLRLLGALDGWEPFIMAGIIVLLVACANAANLMMARSMQRAPEIAIRTSLGASRIRIVRQLLVEASVLAAAAALVAAVFSIGGVALFESAIPAGTLPYWIDYSMDTRVFAALVVVAGATIAIVGLVPALQASRTDVNRTLKDGGRTAAGNRRSGIWTSTFLTAELALAMIMLTQVAIASLKASVTLPTDDAIQTPAVLTTAVTLPAASYRTPERRTDFFRRLNQRLNARPDITAVSRATLLPGEGVTGMRRVDVEGRIAAQGSEAPVFLVIDIAPSYLDTLDLAMLTGRDFTPADANGDAAIVNERFVQVALGGAEPIGVRIGLSPPGAPRDAAAQWRTIVGVMPTIRQQGAGGVEQQTPAVYLPIAATAPPTSILMVRHTLDPEAATQLLREEVRGIDPNIPLYRVRTLARAVADAQWNRRVSAYLATTVCLLSVLLAVVGLYAVTAQRVTLSTHEIGLRVALGAASAHIARVVLRAVRVPLALGLALGTIGALAWDRAFSSGSRDLYAAAATTLITIAALLLAIVAVACFMPLRRALRMNPVTALRHD